jgi:hypothetical protein
MVKWDELIKFITQRLVRHIQMPKQERREARKVRRGTEPWSSRWFGMVPFAIHMWLGGRRKKQ